MAERIVIGTGTGRCGTVSLAKVFAVQLNCIATHEDCPRMPWIVDMNQFKEKTHLVSSRPSHFAASVGMDWGRYLPAVLAMFGDRVRVVVLHRDTEETVESYMRKTSGDKYRNHWTDEPDPRRKMPLNVWDTVYPSYPDLDPSEKRKAITRYVNDWHAQVPDDERIMHMSYRNALNEYGCQMQMLEFCGFKYAVPLVGSVNNATVKGGE